MDHVYTVEPGLNVEDYGYIGLVEDVLDNENGADFLSKPQEELIVVGAEDEVVEQENN